MLLAGDELGRTQLGNNNAYCQDNEISWVDWELDEERVALLEFIGAIVALRREHPVFRRRTFFQGRAVHGAVKDIGWFTPDGTEMDEADWQAPDVSTLGVFLNGEEIPDQDPRGGRTVDDSFMLLLNGGGEPVLFKLPGEPWAKEYELLVDTALAFARPPGADAPSYMAGEELSMASRSLAVLRKRT
jgi:glycogen operon protein